MNRNRDAVGAVQLPYDFRNCQSLFGYAAEVHRRSEYKCELCGCGGPPVNFDMWRQLTVEHLLGQSQGGYLRQLVVAISVRFPTLSASEQRTWAMRIDEANTISACSCCNSMTSRYQHVKTIAELLAVDGTPAEVFTAIKQELQTVLEQKRATVRWKLDSVREAFKQIVVAQKNATT